MKVCSKCKSEKPIDEFFRDRTKKDGRNTQCKVCKRIAITAWRKSPRGRKKQNAKNRARYKRGLKKNRDRRRKIRKERPWLPRFHRHVYYAVLHGTLPRPSHCEDADGTCVGSLHYHHDSYLPGNELNVRPLCARHHKIWHLNNKAITPEK